MKKGYSGKNRKNYRLRRRIRKGASAVLLVLMVLAFVGIKVRENSGTLSADGPQTTQEAGAAGATGRESQSESSESGGSHLPGEATEGSYPPGGAATGVTAQKPDEQPADGSAGLFSLDMVPPYSGRAYTDINGDVPFFTDEEMTAEAFHQYWPLDELGRCTGAYACVGPETLPKQKRGDISQVRPTGWNTNRYSDIDGEMLFNRCHLIGHMLTGQDANERNLITGTRYMNVEGMLPFEESVVMYVEGTGHHVMYRVRPYFDGDNLVCAGVLMEARSVEDPLVQFCAFCYNVQPGITIDYADGSSSGPAFTGSDTGGKTDGTKDQAPERENAGDGKNLQNQPAEAAYIGNRSTEKFHRPDCRGVARMSDANKVFFSTRKEAVADGYEPCGICHP